MKKLYHIQHTLCGFRASPFAIAVRGCLTPWRFVRTQCGNLHPPEVRHLAAPLAGLQGCFRFWECWSLGGREILATKDAEERKESAQPAPNSVQWVHECKQLENISRQSFKCLARISRLPLRVLLVPKGAAFPWVACLLRRGVRS